MFLLPGFAPDKGIHVVSLSRMEDGRLQCEPVIVPEDVLNRVIQSPRGIRWYIDAWNQVHLADLQPTELPPEVTNLPVPSPLTPPGCTIARLERPRLWVSPIPLVPQSLAGRPGQAVGSIKAGVSRPAEIRAVRGVEKAPELRKPRKSAPIPPTDRTTRQAPVTGQRPRLSLDVLYSSTNSPKALATPSNNTPSESAQKTPSSRIGDPEESDNDDSKSKPKKKIHLPKGWQAYYNLQSSHNILEVQDFIHTFAAHPIKPDGTRDIKYVVNDTEHTATLPRSTYGRSLQDILPTDVPRKFWMSLTRHPLIWDGKSDHIKTSNDLPKRESGDWNKSLHSVGLHLLRDFTAQERPTYSMHLLIRAAILGSPFQTLTTNDLRVLLMAKFPYFRENFSHYWYNQISNVHSRQEYSTWLGTHPTLSGSQIKYWNVTDIPQLDIPEDYKFPTIKLIRIKDAKGKEQLAIDTGAPGERKAEKTIILDRAPVVVPDNPVPDEIVKPKPPPKKMTRTKLTRSSVPSPPPETVISTDDADGLSPESEDEFSIADPIEIDLGPLEEEEISPPSPLFYSAGVRSDVESSLPSAVDLVSN